MITFGRKKSLLDFDLVYSRFQFKILRPIQRQRLQKFANINRRDCELRANNEILLAKKRL